MNKLNPLRAGCHIEVPWEIAAKRAVISSYDGQCMLRVVGSHRSIPAEKYTERESSYPHYMTVLNLTNIEFPMILKDIFKFERLNAVSTCTALKMDKSFLCGSSMTRRRSTSISCIYKIHATSALSTLNGSRTCHVSWDRKLLGTKTKNFSAIDNYIWKKLL